MFTIKKFGSREVSFEREELSLNIDVWGEDNLFNPEFAAELHILWQLYMAKPIGVPVRSRMNCSFGAGSTIERPNTIRAELVCKEDADDYEKQVTKGLKKEASFLSWKKIRAAEEADEQVLKANREAGRKAALKVDPVEQKKQQEAAQEAADLRVKREVAQLAEDKADRIAEMVEAVQIALKTQ